MPVSAAHLPWGAKIRAAALCLLAACGVLALASCGEEEERRPSASSAPASGPSALQPAPARPAPARDWLEVGDHTPPEVFLATLSSRSGTSPSPEALAELATLLGTADSLFEENRRMVANRTLQLERMLAGLSLVEPPQALLEGFIAVGRSARRVGYGELCQHYFNLRAAGASRQEALAALGAPAGGRGTP